ncbi:NAD-dependent dehydratase [Desulfamplus magnetovallimortis]|uniref:NAD-dependent dehydratase n=1 Tax=Desulfamplus magnetovallimortis TaxID=1246637 RepID=UPI0024820443|nr:NAD-dependent dehydratase [Desulfamplus magnetovallimortis]
MEDIAKACIDLMMADKDIYDEYTEPMCSHINVGSGVECTIGELSAMMARVTGFSGNIEFDSSKPDGTPRKLLDISKLISFGWAPSVSLEVGLRKTYSWYMEHKVSNQ